MISRNYNVNPSVSTVKMFPFGQYEGNPEAEYGEHIRNTSAVCNSSASHTCGNVLSVIEKYLIDLFPMDFFKTITASSTMASRQIKHLPHQLIKLERPMMVLVPRIVFGQGDDRFLGNTLMNSRYTNTFSFWGDGSLLPLATDRRKHLWIHGHYNRMLMFVDVVLSFDTLNEQINFMSYLHNMLPINHNKLIRAPLELYLPTELCELISKLVKIPVIDKDNSIIKFSRYMNQIWNYPVTFKLKGGSNTNEFFMYYLTDIDSVVQEPQLNDPSKDGQVKRNYNISFTVRAEFNSIGYFTLNHPDVRKSVIVTKDRADHMTTFFSDEINLDDFNLPVGWQILGWPIFKLKEGENQISLDPVFNESIRQVIKYHVNSGIPINRFLNVQFRENGKILESERYFIDWNKRILTVLNPNSHRTYRLMITISPEYINTMIKQLYNLE